MFNPAVPSSGCILNHQGAQASISQRVAFTWQRGEKNDQMMPPSLTAELIQSTI